MVADAFHEGGRGGDRLGQGQLVARKLMGGIVQIELVEYALLIIGGQALPILVAEGLSLGFESAQVGIGRKLVGREFAAVLPQFLTLMQVGLGNHPTKDFAQFIDIFTYRK